MKERPEKLDGCTIMQKTGCGNIYVTINHDADGKPFELFAEIGKGGGCASAQSEGIARSVSIGLRNGVPIADYAHTLRGVICKENNKADKKYACVDAIAKAIDIYIENINKEGMVEKK